MARRKRNEPDLLGGILTLLMVATFFGTFQLTKSVGAATVALLIYFIVAFVVALIIRQFEEEKLKRSGITDIDKMTGRQFEYYLGHLFRSQGYEVKVTRESGDYGADLVIQKNGKKIVIQAKRYSKDVGIKAIQEVQGSIAYYGASEAWVVTNRDFTEAAYNLAKANNVRLINREQLIEMILQMNPSAAPKPKQIIEALPERKIVCDRCGKPMVLRKGTSGEFYGCSGYPKCRNVKVLKGIS
jgi:restriction system protein